MAVLVVYFLKAVEVQNDEAERQAITASARKFLFEGFGEEPPVVEARERVGYGADLKLAVLFVFEDHRNADQASAEEHVHKNRFESNRTAKRFGKLPASSKYLFPELQALGLVQVQMRNRAKVSLQKLTAGRNIQPFEHLDDQLEISFFSR
jgi:hypothetical protein